MRLDELDLTAFTQGWGQAQPGLSVTKTPLRIAGKTFAHGVGTHAESDVTVRLDGQAQTFTAQVGVDDNARNAAAALLRFAAAAQLLHARLASLGRRARARSLRDRRVTLFFSCCPCTLARRAAL